ncbi:MAG: hypothetical protein ACLT8E_02040 [Akkermansia sp.]
MPKELDPAWNRPGSPSGIVRPDGGGNRPEERELAPVPTAGPEGRR